MSTAGQKGFKCIVIFLCVVFVGSFFFGTWGVMCGKNRPAKGMAIMGMFSFIWTIFAVRHFRKEIEEEENTEENTEEMTEEKTEEKTEGEFVD